MGVNFLYNILVIVTTHHQTKKDVNVSNIFSFTYNNSYNTNQY
jgi:hypothetical protein